MREMVKWGVGICREIWKECVLAMAWSVELQACQGNKQDYKEAESDREVSACV